MVNMLLSILFQTMSAPVLALSMERMVTPNNDRTSRWGRIALWTASFFVFGAAHIIWLQSWWQYIIQIGQYISIIALALCCYEEKRWKRLIAAALLMGMLLIADLTYILLSYLFYDSGISGDFSQADMMIGSLVVNMLGMLFMVLVSELWRRIWRRGRGLENLSMYTLITILTVPLLFVLIYQTYNSTSMLPWNYLVVFMSVFFSSLALVFILFNQSEKRELAEELAEARRLAELERVHYSEMEKRREEVAKIRHDYNNLLSSVMFLNRQGDHDEANKLLSELSVHLRSTREYPYCGIPIVNAVLSEKKEVCDGAGIDFHAELALPDALPVDRIDLCRAMGNLMDNAIRACRAAELAAPVIELNCGIRGGYLVVRCVNTAPATPGTRPEGTGYGLKILDDIARNYHGNFFAEQQNGRFTAQLCLLVEGLSE